MKVKNRYTVMSARKKHTKRRLKERYGIRASNKQLQQAAHFIANNQGSRLIALTGSKSLCRIPKRIFDGAAKEDEFIYVVYSKTRSTICTALPSEIDLYNEAFPKTKREVM